MNGPRPRPTPVPQDYRDWAKAASYADALARLRSHGAITLGHRLADGAAENA